MLRILLLFLLLSLTGYSQSDTNVISLPPAEIMGTKHTFHSGFPATQLLDTGVISRLEAHTLADRLDREGSLFIKSYGPGSISTVSIRGTGAAHTAVSWQGMPLNSPMLGLTDMSLLPAFLMDDILIHYGGNGPLNGAGAVGGSIVLGNTLNATQGFSVQGLAGGGSFGQMRAGAAFRYANGKAVTQTKVYSESSQNNFDFTRPDGSVATQNHAGFRQTGFTQDLRYGSSKTYGEAHIWYLENDRDIPPLMISSLSRQEQQDKAVRAIAGINFIGNKHQVKFRTGFSDEHIHYVDPEAKLNEFSRAQTFQADAEAGFVLSSSFTAFLQGVAQLATAEVTSYRADGRQDQESMSANLLFEKGNYKAQVAVKQSLFNGDFLPLLPSFSFSVQLHRNLSLRGDAAMIYRLPTLNDRYWQPGGNNNLQAESGTQGSAGFCYSLKKGTIGAEFTANAFAVHLEQAIVWLPGADGIYRVDNIQVLDSRGADAMLRLNYSTRHFSINLTGGPVYTNAVITKADAAYAASLNKQLIYTPLILWKGHLQVSYKSWTFRYHHAYTGYRYVTTDHSHFLDPFDIADCTLSKFTQLQRHQITISMSIKNIYNTNYQVIAWRAMPGRWYEAGIFYSFGTKKP